MKKTLHGARLFGCLVAAAMLAVTPSMVIAQTADVPKKSPAKQQGKSKPKPMSRDQLRACMDQQDRLLVMRESVLKEQSLLDQQRADVARLDAELERKRVALDPADAAAKQAVADEEMRRNQAGDAYNARLPGLKDQGAMLDRERQSWVERCADKDFDERDEFAIKREKVRAAKAGGEKTPAK